MTQTTRSDPPVCGRCAQIGPTCCVLAPGQEELCFPVSELERQRVVEHMAHLKGGFTTERNSAAFVDNLMRLFPRERDLVAGLFPAHGAHLRLSTGPDGRCRFLGPEGCSLPGETRPYYCRLFPFWVVNGRLTAFSANGCLALREGRNVAAMLAALGARAKDMLELHGRLRLAWGFPPQEGLPRIERAKVKSKP